MDKGLEKRRQYATGSHFSASVASELQKPQSCAPFWIFGD